MVVGDDDLQPVFPGPGHFGGVADAAVHRHQQAGPGGQLLQRPDAEAVAFLQAVRNMGGAGKAQFAQELVQQAGGGEAVGVVVPVNGHGFLVAHRQAQAGGGRLHVRESERWVEALQGGVQKGQNLLGSVQTPVQQDAGHQRRQPVAGAHLAHQPFRVRINLPAHLAAQRELRFGFLVLRFWFLLVAQASRLCFN